MPRKRQRLPQTFSLLPGGRSRPLRFEPLEPRRLLAADFGDAPAPYPTLLEDDGPRHMAVGPQLGPTRGTQEDGQPSPGADADTSDDGVTFGTIRVGQLGATLTVNVEGGPGKLDAWIDFNGDGNWGGPGERIFFAHPLEEGDNVLTFAVPGNAKIGSTFARFRVSSAGSLGIGGSAIDGEVEDHSVVINPPRDSSGHFRGPHTVLRHPGPFERAYATDFDGDGDLDFVTATYQDADVAWHENVGDQNYVTHTLPSGSSGRGQVVTVGDMDGDGDLDVVVGNSFYGHLTWYENEGDSSFVRHSLSETVGKVTSVNVVDMDSDGDLDLLVDGTTITWYENVVPGEFVPRVIEATPNVSQAVSAVDLDSDGDLDIVGHINSADVVWYENNGSQGFAKRLIDNRDGVGHDLLALDMDGDGDIDLVASSAIKPPFPNAAVYLNWYENDGLQSFTARSISSGASSSALQVRTLIPFDVEGDADIDLLVNTANWNRPPELYLNDGSANFSLSSPFATNPGEYFDLAADVDGDGDLDLVGHITPFDTSPPSLVWYENVLAATLVSPPGEVLAESSNTQLSLTFALTRPRSVPTSLTFAISGTATFGADYLLTDAATFDGSTGTVIVPAGETSVAITLTLLDDELEELAETFAVRLIDGVDYAPFESASEVWTIDSEERGADYGDLPAPYEPSLHGPLAAHSQGGPGGPRLGQGFDVETGPQPNALADGEGPDDDGVTFGTIRVGQLGATITVNVQGGPGKLDAWIDFNTDGNWGLAGEQIFVSRDVVEGDNLLTFDVPPWALAGETYARFRVSTAGGLLPYGDAADGEVEDYRLTISPSARTVGEFDNPTSIVPEAVPLSMVSGDIDGDGDIDLATVISNRGTRIAWYENQGTDGFTAHTIELGVNDVRLADMDGDGDLDIVAWDLSNIYWLENDATHSFTQQFRVNAVTLNAQDLEFADLNGDGRLDIAAATSGGLYWFQNGDSPYFARHTVSTSSATIRTGIDVVAADVNADGHLDLVVAGDGPGGSGVYRYLNNGTGQFSGGVIQLSPGSPRVFVGDFNQDGRLDFLTHSTSWITLLRQRPGGAFESVDLIATGISGMTTADFDGDGDIDIVFGASSSLYFFEHIAEGLFTRRDIPQPPNQRRALIADDIDGNGTVDLIVSGDPVRGILVYSQPIAPSVEVLNPMVNEATDESLHFRISIDVATSVPLEVPFNVTGSAAWTGDYTLEGATTFDGTIGTVTIPAGSSSVDLFFRPVEDELAELTESIVVTATLGASSALGAILADPAGGDYGDAPAPYPTAPLEQGPGHLATGPTLGPTRGSGSFGVSDPNADGDPGDDGVTFDIVQIGKLDSQVTVNVGNATGPVRLDAWIDFNADGNWGQPQEQIFRSIEVLPGENVLTFAVPGEAKPGTTFARFRLSTTGGLLVTGDAPDGEVEDYAVTIASPPRVPVHLTEVPAEGDQANLREGVAIDFDFDGDIDVVGLVANKLVWLEQTDGVEFVTHVLGIGSTFGGLLDLDVGDVDGDGDLDVVTTEFYESAELGPPVLHRNNDFLFATELLLPEQWSASSAELADIDGDGDLDLVATTFRDVSGARHGIRRDLVWMENDGTGVFTPHTIGNGARVVGNAEAIDFDKDGDLDILTTESGMGGIVWYENNGHQVFTRQRVSSVRLGDDFSRHAMFVHAADVDNDGDFDLFEISESGQPDLVWHEQVAPGEFVTHIITSSTMIGREITSADMDGDGDLDLLYTELRHGTTGPRFAWAENRLAGDYNNDGTLDAADYLVWKEAYGSTEGEGLRADGNGDGVVDAADYLFWRNRLGSDREERFFVLQAAASGHPYYFVHPADIDGDGDLDLLAGNNGSFWLENGAPNSNELAVEPDNDIPALLARPVTSRAFFAPIPRTPLAQRVGTRSPLVKVLPVSTYGDSQRLDLLDTPRPGSRPASYQVAAAFPSTSPTERRRLLALDEAFGVEELAIDVDLSPLRKP